MKVMTDDTKNLVLEHLTAMRASLARLEENDAFMNARMSSIEQHMAGVRAEIGGIPPGFAGIRSDMASMIGRIDSMEKCLDRIERRLGFRSV